MKIRPGVPGDSARVAELIASFQPQLTLEPSGVGAEQYLASVSEDSERAYLGSHRYAYIVAEHGRVLAGFIAVRDRSHVFHLFVATQYQGLGLARRLWSAVTDGLASSDDLPPVFTVNASLNAIPVYECFGFEAAGPSVRAHGIAFQPMRLHCL